MTGGEGLRIQATAPRGLEGARPPNPVTYREAAYPAAANPEAPGLGTVCPDAADSVPIDVLAGGERPAQIRAVEDLWFWFMRQRCPDGTTAGRPRAVVAAQGEDGSCHPLDVFRVVDGLYRRRRLDRDHLAVLGHYGRRQSPPDPRRRREQRAELIWREALERLAPALRRRGLIP